MAYSLARASDERIDWVGSVPFILVHLSPLHIDDWFIGIAGGFLAVFVPSALLKMLRILPAPRHG